jgi:hypothetical protein
MLKLCMNAEHKICFFASNPSRINTSENRVCNFPGINTSKSPRNTFILNDFNSSRINTSEKLRSNPPRINTSKKQGMGWVPPGFPIFPPTVFAPTQEISARPFKPVQASRAQNRTQPAEATMKFSSRRTSSTLPARSVLALFVAALFALSPLQDFAHAADSPAAPAEQQSTAPADATTTTDATTTLKDQTDLSLTVYNSQLALVRDVRQIDLPAGESRLRFMDIASSINPATVHFRSVADPTKLNVLEQDYEYDLLDPAKLLEKYVGREVTLVRAVQKDGSTDFQQSQATLLSDNAGGPVWKVGDEIVTGMATDSYRFPDLPGNLYDRPTLLWLLDNRGAPRQTVEASYLTSNISWSADYVLTIGHDENSADLNGWVTLVNNSGTAFENAQLQLVAGDVHRAPAPPPPPMEMMQAADAAVGSGSGEGFSQEAFSEYHLYTLGRRTSIENNETKQISLLSAAAFPVERRYVVNGQNWYYHSAAQPGEPIKDPVEVYYKFQNEEKSGLGMPLPAGTVRVYEADSHGGVLFIGEDNIEHTPKDESVDLHVGSAFDIVAERKQTDYQAISNRVVEMEYEITLRNHKDTPVTVEVNEPIGGDWQMLSSTYNATKTSAFAAQFEVPVAQNGTSVLRYRVRVHW